MGLLHEELTYEIIGCIYDVHKGLGIGFDEETYHLAMEQQLVKEGIPFKSKVVKFLNHRGRRVHKFIPDLVIADTVILELKNITSDFTPANYLQIISYLKYWQKDLGLLVNFGLQSAKYKRVLFSEREKVLIEDYEGIEDIISKDYRYAFEATRTALLNIFNEHGLGYDFTIYRALFLAELAYQNIRFDPSILIPVPYDGKILRTFELEIPLIHNQIICGITAGQTDLKPYISKMRNYLKTTNFQVGILANFGKEELEIIGIRC